MSAVFLHTAPECRSIREFLRGIPLETRSVGMFVGPEGGFSADELARCQILSAVPVRAGNRILRTETAGVVMAFCLLRMME